MTSFGLFSPFLEFVLMTNPPLINLRIAPYVKAGHTKVGAVFKSACSYLKKIMRFTTPLNR